MRACNAPFFRVVKVFNKKAVRRTNPWEFGQGVGGRNGTKRMMMKILAFVKIFAVKI